MVTLDYFIYSLESLHEKNGMPETARFVAGGVRSWRKRCLAHFDGDSRQMQSFFNRVPPVFLFFSDLETPRVLISLSENDPFVFKPKIGLEWIR